MMVPTSFSSTTQGLSSLFSLFSPFFGTISLQSSLSLFWNILDAILPRKGLITRTMARRLQEDWARDAGEDPRALMSLRVDFGPMR